MKADSEKSAKLMPRNCGKKLVGPKFPRRLLSVVGGRNGVCHIQGRGHGAYIRWLIMGAHAWNELVIIIC